MVNSIFFKYGESINLQVPDTTCIDTMRSWTEMMNDQEVTRFIGQGMYPQSIENQKRYVDDFLSSRKRIVLTIHAKKTKTFLGIISLSDIDLTNRRAQLSTVCPFKCDTVRYAALQARALLSDHAFRKIGLSVVYSYQVYPENKKWAQASEVIGYFPSGFSLNSYFYNGNFTHRLIIGLTREKYFSLCGERDSIWPGCEEISRRLHEVKNFSPRADALFDFVINQNYMEE